MDSGRTSGSPFPGFWLFSSLSRGEEYPIDVDPMGALARESTRLRSCSAVAGELKGSRPVLMMELPTPGPTSRNPTMRRPLRFQIMIPMLGLMVTALAGVSILNAYLGAGRAKRQIEEQLRGITQTLERSNFPLTDSVLRQMRGLSGAEFVLVTNAGTVVASSTKSPTTDPLPENPTADSDVVLHRRITLGGTTYFHTAKRLARNDVHQSSGILHILYPETGYRQAWIDAVYPPLVIGLAAVVFVALSAVLVAARASRPMTRLQTQVSRIAEGDFEPMPLPDRRDEIRDLAVAINQMATMLGQYEREVRETERLRTLAQLGGGIAHQMRNAATGCRMAVDILAGEQSLSDDCESLAVARRQLELMERYLRRFLAIGKPPREVDLRPVDLGALVEEILPLVRPAARHAGVDLRWHRPESPSAVSGDAEGLEQVVINLVLNAIEAASSQATPDESRVVRVCLQSDGGDRVVLLVEDTGPGPRDDVRETLFDPFVSAKADGVGLGLSVAQQVTQQHGGRITWSHEPGATRFRVELPQMETEKHCVELAGR
ncbi:MAG: HAMP domain-containing histidine kinase [Planctomycetes bacterium]|nr:HAMP domain-containing histidine kinase [Planctomycetota bacterium]